MIDRSLDTARVATGPYTFGVECMEQGAGRISGVGDTRPKWHQEGLPHWPSAGPHAADQPLPT